MVERKMKENKYDDDVFIEKYSRCRHYWVHYESNFACLCYAPAM